MGSNKTVFALITVYSYTFISAVSVLTLYSFLFIIINF